MSPSLKKVTIHCFVYWGQSGWKREGRGGREFCHIFSPSSNPEGLFAGLHGPLASDLPTKKIQKHSKTLSTLRCFPLIDFMRSIWPGLMKTGALVEDALERVVWRQRSCLCGLAKKESFPKSLSQCNVWPFCVFSRLETRSSREKNEMSKINRIN